MKFQDYLDSLVDHDELVSDTVYTILKELKFKPEFAIEVPSMKERNALKVSFIIETGFWCNRHMRHGFYSYNAALWWFEDGKDAMLFKLTWG